MSEPLYFPINVRTGKAFLVGAIQVLALEESENTKTEVVIEIDAVSGERFHFILPAAQLAKIGQQFVRAGMTAMNTTGYAGSIPAGKQG